MGPSIDITGYQSALDTNNQALWTFAIQDQKVNFWGRYDDAASTAQQYAQIHGIHSGNIRLLDCTGAWRGITRH